MTQPPRHSGSDTDSAAWTDDPFAALGGLLEGLRGLEAPVPSDRPAAVLRARLVHRMRYRESLRPWNLAEGLVLLSVRFKYLLRHSRPVRVFAALSVLALLLLISLPLLRRALARANVPAVVVVANDSNDSLERRVAFLPLPDVPVSSPLLARPDRAERLAVLASENDLQRLRVLYDERGKVALRRRLLRIGGADDRTRRRIEGLAVVVAEDLEKASVTTDYASVEALSLGLRALLASGSTTVRGRHSRAVRLALRRLEGILPRLEGAELTTALAAYLEVANVTGGGRLERLSAELTRLVESQAHLLVTTAVLAPRAIEASVINHPEPVHVWARRREAALPMNRWACPLGALADAGLLLRVAPALGVSAREAALVRNAIYDHLHEVRSKEPGSRGVAADAAMLFSFSDLADRDALRANLHGHALQPDLFGRDIRAVHFLAWSIFPGAGWARFNQGLRYFAANYRDQTPTERAGLLLVQLLYTAPGL